MAVFDDWQLAEAQEAIAEAAADADPLYYALRRTPAGRPEAELRSRWGDDLSGAEANRRYYLGDHWQDGRAWIGPRPETSSARYDQVMDEIEAGFVSKNVIREIIRRHRNALIGTEPLWRVTLSRPLKAGEEPSPAEASLIEEAEAVLSVFWDRRDLLGQLQKAVDAVLWAGRAYVRLFVPAGELDSNGLIPRADLQTSILRIRPDVPDITQAAIAIDPDTYREAGVYVFEDDEGGAGGEICYLDESGNTRLRALEAEEGAEVYEATLPLGGRLFMVELRREPLVNQQIRDHQNVLNMALTMLARNVVLGGFLERVILNAQLPGRYEEDPADPKRMRFVPDEFHVGAGTTNTLMGAPIYDEAGNVKGYTSPNVVYRDPVSTETFMSTRLIAYQGILEEADQLHVLMSGDATASGESRIQAMAQFEQSLKETKATLNKAGRWVLETALALAANFAGAPGRYEALRVDFDAKIDLGPVPALEIDAVIKENQAGLIAKETARSRIGIDDPAAEETKIQAEAEAALEKQVEVSRRLGLAVPGQPPEANPAQGTTQDQAGGPGEEETA